jgi:uncharacterized delta-60 repeat protein
MNDESARRHGDPPQTTDRIEESAMLTLRSRLSLVLPAAMAASLLLVVTPVVTLASASDLDPTWDGDGIVTTAMGGGSGVQVHMAIASDGKVVAASDCVGSVFDFCLARYNTDGSLDTTFDGDGKVATDFGTFDSAYGVAIDSTGKIVAAGSCGGTTSIFCVARYNTDGSLDTTFSGDGRVMTDVNNNNGANTGGSQGRAVVIQPDDKIVVAGYCGHFDANFFVLRDACLARYNTDGSLDSTFAGDGTGIYDLGTSGDFIYAAALQADGSIVIGGGCGTFPNGSFCLARITASGAFDSTFGTVTTAMGSTSSTVGDLALAATGEIVAAGGCIVAPLSQNAFCIARYNANGSLDTTFNGTGKVTTVVQGGGNAQGIALQADGKLVAVGNCPVIGQNFLDFCLARYNPDGTLDSSFGSGGTLTTSISSNNDYPGDVLIAANGRILVSGFCPTDWCLARYLGDPVTTDTSAPVITISTATADTKATSGWYNLASSGSDGVLVQVSASDDTAVTNLTCTDGVATVLDTSTNTGSFVLGAGNHSISCTASDGVNPPGAGSGSTAMPFLANVDQVPPTVACVQEPWLQLHQSVSSLELADISDATSGPTITQYFLSAPNTSTPGVHAVAIGIDDNAGNVTNTTCNYRVIYTFAGFAAPISTGTYDYVNAVIGSVIPFRFTLTDANGQAVNGITNVTVQELAGSCIGTSHTLTKSEYSKGKVGLVSLGNGSYEYRLKAPKSDRNQCRLVALTLPDGMTYAADIKFAP